MPEMRSSTNTTGSKRQQQSFANVSQKKVSYSFLELSEPSSTHSPQWSVKLALGHRRLTGIQRWERRPQQVL